MRIFIVILLCLIVAGCQQPVELGASPEYVTAPENNTFKVGRLNYDAILETDITNEQPLKYQLGDKYISFSPVEIRWDDKKLNTIKPKKATINPKNYKYKDAFGEGIDIDLNFGDRVFEKIVKINALEDLGEIPDDAQYLEIEFEVNTNLVIDGWNKEDEFEVVDKVRLGDYSYLEQPMVWDSYVERVCNNPNPDDCDVLRNRIDIQSYLNSKGSKLLFTKKIPVSWLETAQFPVYTDADVTYGTADTFETGVTRAISVAELDTDKFVVCYGDDADADAGKCNAATVSGTTITYGTIAEFDADIKCTSCFWDTGVAKLDTDSFVVTTWDDSVSDLCRAWAATVSGTTITYGSAQTLTNSLSAGTYCRVAQIDTNKFAAAGTDNPSQSYAVVGTVANRVVTVGDAVNWTPVLAKYLMPVKIDTDKFAIFYEDSNDSGKAKLVASTVSTRTIDGFSATSTIDANDSYLMDGAAVEADKIVIVWSGDTGHTGQISACTYSGTTPTCGTAVEYESGLCNLNSVALIPNSPSDITKYVTACSDAGDTYKGKSNYCTADWSDRSFSCSTPETFETGDITLGVENNSFIESLDAGKLVICFSDDSDSDRGKCIIGDAAYEAAPAGDTDEHWHHIIIFE